MATIECPDCERGHLYPDNPAIARCSACGRVPERWILETLRDIASLPAGAGTHACECGHPEMRRLPDGTFRCPACGQEVLSFQTTQDLWKFRLESEAYRQGWLDGYLGEARNFATSTRLAAWQGARERLDYYRGHQAGSRERLPGDANMADHLAKSHLTREASRIPSGGGY